MHPERKITVEYGGHKKVAYFIPATDEQFVVKELLIDECYEFSFSGSDVVLNLGGHIGMFDVTYFERVKEIRTFEPCKVQFEKLQRHIKENGIENVKAFNRAVVNGDEKEVRIYGDSGHHTLLGSGECETCEAVDIKEVLKEANFTKIKCDIEGGEYSLFVDLKVPQSVNEIWFETHTRDTDMQKNHYQLINNLKDQGFNVKEIENDYPKNRTFLLHCKR